VGQSQNQQTQEGWREDQKGEGMGIQSGHRPTYFRKT